MSALDDDKSKRLCSLIEKNILKDGYFILDVDDWDSLHIDYKPVLHGKNYEYADYTEITVSLDKYQVSDKVQVRYNFIRSVYAGRTGDSYRVYYKREDGKLDGGTPYSMDDAAKFIANRFIELVDDKIMDKKLEARIARLEKLIRNKSIKNESADMNELISVANFFDEASSSAGNYLSWLPEELDDDELEEELINFQQAARRCRDILNKDYINNDHFINRLGKWANR